MRMDLRKYIRNLKSQSSVDCCTASACLHAIELMANRQGISVNYSRLYVYYMTRLLQGNQNGGCKLANTFDALRMYGACRELLWPFRLQKINDLPPTNVIEDGLQHKLQEVISIRHSDINKFITYEIPVIIGLNIGRLFYEIRGPLGFQYYKPINNFDNERKYGHSVTIVGFDDSICNGSWIIANSFGQTWGDYGFGILPYACAVDIGEIYVIKKFAEIEADKKIFDI